MSPDGSFLLFISSRPQNPLDKPIDGFFNGKAQPGQGGNLWRADWNGSRWSEPVRLPEIVNRSKGIYAPSVVKDGSAYFMEAGGEKNTFRLYRSQFRNGQYERPEPVPFSSGEVTDVDPAVAPDESFAVFGSSRPPALVDLFIVFRQNGTWGTPLHMGTAVNSPGSDAEPRLDPDQRTLYFSSDRVLPINFPRDRDEAERDLKRIEEWDNGNYNIWQISLDSWLKAKHQEEKVASQKGKAAAPCCQ